MKRSIGLLLALTANPALAADLSVYAVNGPLGYFAERLAGELVEVTMPAPGDEDPAFWQPDALAIGDFQAADLILLNGAGYAKWVENASLPRAKQLVSTSAFEGALIEEEGQVSHSHAGGDPHSHAGTAFTTWLDFDQARSQAEALAQGLRKLNPDQTAEIDANLQALEADLMALDQAATQLGQDLAGTPIIVSHPIYQYLARAYDMNLISLTWEPDVEPDAAQLVDLDALIIETDAQFLLWEDQPIDTAATLVAERGLTNLVFKTGNNAQPNDDFIALMEQGLADLRQAVP